MSRFPCLSRAQTSVREHKYTDGTENGGISARPLPNLSPRLSVTYTVTPRARTRRQWRALWARAVGARNAHGARLRCGAINTGVTPITQRVDHDVLSRENRNYPPAFLFPSPSCAHPTGRRRTALPFPIAPKFRIISATVASPVPSDSRTDY